MIRGNLVTLGPLLPADFELLFYWANDPDLARLNETYRPIGWKNYQEWFAGVGKDPAQVTFAIRSYQSAGKIIGYVQILNIDAVNHSATIGLRIGDPANRGRGYGSEALALALDYCWKHLNLSRVGLAVFDGNQAALAVYRRAGFKKEGVLRRAMFIDGRWVDLVLMAIMQRSRRNPPDRQ